MTWFKVDDTFHAHPKVLATNPAALGLWVVAGAWSSAHLTEGYVPDHALPRLLPDSATLARALVAAGLWCKVRGGYRFHDWTDYNPTKEEATTVRAKESSGGAIGNHRRWHVARGVSDAKCRYCQPKRASPPDRPPDRVPESHPESPDPSRPDPTLRGTGREENSPTRARASPEPPPRCPDHLDDPHPPPCGPCADARRAHEAWEANRPLPNRLSGSPDYDTIERAAVHGDRRTQRAAQARAALPTRQPAPGWPSALDQIRALTDPPDQENPNA